MPLKEDKQRACLPEVSSLELLKPVVYSVWSRRKNRNDGYVDSMSITPFKNNRIACYYSEVCRVEEYRIG
jgi:putative heme degradation protein